MNYLDLYELFKLKNIEYNVFLKLKNDFFEDKNLAVIKNLEYKNFEILSFTDFIFFYMSENTISYFHNINSIGYTNKLKKLLEKENIKIDFDFEKFVEMENDYDLSLLDILIAKLNFKLEKLGLKIIGINTGLDFELYFLTTIKEYINLKNINSKLYTIIDTYYYEKIHNEIYENLIDFENLPKGNYLKKYNNKYITLFEKNKKNLVYYLDEEKIKDIMEIII